jgi:hypothetical protein
VRDTYVDLANRVQAQTGIPYLLIDGRFENTPAALRLLGEALGVPERGEALAQDAEATFARIDALLAEHPRGGTPDAPISRAAPRGWKAVSSARSTPRSSNAPAGSTCSAGPTRRAVSCR